VLKLGAEGGKLAIGNAGGSARTSAASYWEAGGTTGHPSLDGRLADAERAGHIGQLCSAIYGREYPLAEVDRVSSHTGKGTTNQPFRQPL
jgi:hypothetical protein